MGSRAVEIEERLHDGRGRQVVFLSHCLLNQNVRYPGGAGRSGGVLELVDGYLRQGVGVCQMPCPEQQAWGGVRKRLILPAFGSGRTWRAPVIRCLLPLFETYTRWRYRRLAARVAADVQSCVDADVAVLAIIGVGGSPSCGAFLTLDLAGAVTELSKCPLVELNRERVNTQVIAAHVMPGTGWFIEALRERLRRRRLVVPIEDHDLLSELDVGLPEAGGRRSG